MLFCPKSSDLDILLCRNYKLHNGDEEKSQVCQKRASLFKLAKGLGPFLEKYYVAIGNFFGRAGIMIRFLFLRMTRLPYSKGIMEGQEWIFSSTDILFTY